MNTQTPKSAACSAQNCQCQGSCQGANCGTQGKCQCQATCASCKAQNCQCPKNCGTCGSQLKGGMKYQDICTTCQPVYNSRCSGCQHLLWDCMCIRPHTWE